jgi:hypothetical protein
MLTGGSQPAKGEFYRNGRNSAENRGTASPSPLLPPVMALPKFAALRCDETDREFYDLAKHRRAMLITGHLKHYPRNTDFIVNPADYLAIYARENNAYH